MTITLEQLHKIFPNSHLQNFVGPINDIIEKYQINTPNRQAMFLAQAAHESQEFSSLSENLHYSASRLLEVFPRYFNSSNVSRYAGNPEAIANRVYANRMGNGKESSGDGYMFRGRGLFQLTGKSNYIACGKFLEQDLAKNPDWVSTNEGAVASAAWFWDSNNLNKFADKNNISGCTKKINGGLIGLAERTAYWKTALTVLTK